MTEKEMLDSLGKSQVVRIIDVLAIAPLLVIAGMQERKLPEAMRLALILVGAWTAIYNAGNWLAIDAATRIVEAKEGVQ